MKINRCECGHTKDKHYDGLGKGCTLLVAGFPCKCEGFVQNKDDIINVYKTAILWIDDLVAGLEKSPILGEEDLAPWREMRNTIHRLIDGE